MSKHTPGPWIVDEACLVWAEAAGEYVALTDHDDAAPIPMEQREANARLIAAAPELLEALEALSPHRTGYGQSMDWQAYNEAQKKARAAIAKAKGES